MSPRPCPICKKPRSEEFAPFCSSRCRDRDLNQWFNEGYAVPGPSVDPEELERAEQARRPDNED
jgi:endogenous inhibitor of DNA gyrase (YacG/DUF329 family)